MKKIIFVNASAPFALIDRIITKQSLTLRMRATVTSRLGGAVQFLSRKVRGQPPRSSRLARSGVSPTRTIWDMLTQDW